MSKWREIVSYGMCVNQIDGKRKDYCEHFLAGGKEGSPEALFCSGCGCHRCYHKKNVIRREIDYETAIVKYGKCVRPRNGEQSVFDGCGEFVAADKEGTPKALFCGACGCHRSFHEKYY